MSGTDARTGRGVWRVGQEPPGRTNLVSIVDLGVGGRRLVGLLGLRLDFRAAGQDFAEGFAAGIAAPQKDPTRDTCPVIAKALVEIGEGGALANEDWDAVASGAR